MLELYYGSIEENTEEAVYEALASELRELKAGERIIVLVPDQFTLEQERKLIKGLNAPGIMDIEVLSPTRLISRVMAETGGSEARRIDAYGREMLLTKIVYDKKNELSVFGGAAEKKGFIKKLNDTIYELKQYAVSVEELARIAGETKDGLLGRKLSDLLLIYSEYESYKGEIFLDGEDYLSLFLSKAADSGLIRESRFWLMGFDSFTPKNMELLKLLLERSKNLSLVMNYDEKDSSGIYELSRNVFSELGEYAREKGIECGKHECGREEKRGEKRKLKLVCALNPEAELRAAAAEVLRLLRDKGLRYRDIALICNDVSYRSRMAKRIFREYGLELFIDERKSVLGDRAAALCLCLTELAIKGYRSDKLIALLKTGLFLDEEKHPYREIERLENYAIKYKLTPSEWKNGFKKGEFEYGEALGELEELRAEICERLSSFEKSFKLSRNLRSRAGALYYYLKDELGIEGLAKKESWDAVVSVLEQMDAVLGQENVSMELFAEILESGLKAAEFGVLPPGEDVLMMGTMQRSRFSETKALVIVAANEGILPFSESEGNLLSEDEREKMYGKDAPLSKLESLRQTEERIRIEENIAGAKEYLYMSYAASDQSGETLQPSRVFSELLSAHPDALKETGGALSGMESEKSSRIRLSQALARLREGKELSSEERALLRWHENNSGEAFESLKKGLLFRNAERDISREFARALYRRRNGEYIMSPSSLERYSKCPFAYFVTYALRPEERRVFELSNREVGDIYHRCLMEISARLSEGCEPSSEESRWQSVTGAELLDMVSEFLKNEAARFRGGIMKNGAEESYRSDRMKLVLTEALYALAEHVRCGRIKKMELEKPFGGAEEGALPAIKLNVGDERVSVEGRIDRLDRLEGGSVKIIDYKSGNEKFDKVEAEAGWRLQLMLYLKAAEENGRNKPAGVFYFLLKDAMTEEGSERSYKLDGIVLDDEGVLRDIAGEEGKEDAVLPISRNKDGTISKRSEGRILSAEAFGEFENAVMQRAGEIARSMAEGKIEISPMRAGDELACKFCAYKGLCLFDERNPGAKIRKAL